MLKYVTKAKCNALNVLSVALVTDINTVIKENFNQIQISHMGHLKSCLLTKSLTVSHW